VSSLFADLTPRNNVYGLQVDYSGEVARLRPPFAAMFAVLAFTAGASTAYAAPPAPTGLQTTPHTPGNVATPVVTGTAQASTTVKLYTTSNCTGTVFASGTSAAFASPGLTISSLGSDGNYTIYATATDGTGTSACSTGVAYTLDRVPPGAPSFLASFPVSPSNQQDIVKISGSAETGSTVRLFQNGTCTGVANATDTSDAFNAGFSVSVNNNATTIFSANATDAAGNTSTCSSSLNYTEDSIAPAAPTGLSTSPASLGNTTSPAVLGSAEAGSTVKLYTTTDCSGTAVASGSATAFALGIIAPATANTTTTFKATATDAAGNLSPCSSGVSYTEDSVAPAAPTALTASPSSPSNDDTPTISGTSEAGSTVTLYASSNCTGTPLGSGTAAAFGSPGITVTVTDNTTTQITAHATDAAGNVSPCSSALSFVEDSIAPATPSSLSVSPTGPANNNSPKVKGTAEAGSTVRIYTTSGCTGVAASTVSAATFGSGVTEAVLDDTSTTWKATATDAAGNVSPCSSGVTYVEDSTPPAAPTGLASSPASPSNIDTPHISGTAEANSTVKIYGTSDCSGSPLQTGPEATFLSSGLAVTVTDNTTTFLSATATDAAGNTSACSGSISYLEDSIAPNTPSGLAASPASPSNHATPLISGTAEAGSTVRVYSTSDCSGTPLASGSAAAFASPGLPVTVTADATNHLFATAKDAAGNTSTCSTALTYIEDQTAPAAPSALALTPAGPANNNAPKLRGTAETGSTVRVYTTSDCSGASATNGSASTFNNPGLTQSVADDTTTTFYATATDAAGNTSACSAGATYVEDSTSAKPTGLAASPASPANNNAPRISGTAEAGSTVNLYKTSDCSGTPIATDTEANFASPGIAITVTDDTTTTIYAEATDLALNVSACSAGLPYVEDSTAPVAPSGLAVSPASGSNSRSPAVRGTAEAGSTVSLYTSADCSGSAAAINTAAAFTSPGINVPVAADDTTNISARATDVAGNVSACSTPVSYREDSTAPALTIVGPGSTTSPTPPLTGTAGTSPGDGDTVTITVYAGAGTSGPVVATLTATRDALSGAYSATPPALASGTYTAQVSQSDNAGNTGTSTTVTFVVTLLSPPPNDPGNPGPIAHGSLKGTLIVTLAKTSLAHGRVTVRLSCLGVAGQTCKGSVLLRSTKKKNGRALKYSIAAGTSKVAKLTLPSRALRGVRPHHKVKLVVVVVGSKQTKTISVRR
jgi:large repetitive protein